MCHFITSRPLLPVLGLLAAQGLLLLQLAAAPADDMAAAIERDLNHRCTGYGYALYQNGVYLRGGGGGTAASGAPDSIFDPGTPFDENTVKDCHSMSKTITAAAMVKAMSEAGINPETEKMWKYLPADLSGAITDDDIKDVTFHDLLRHRSGFGGSMSFSWAELKSQLQGGLANPIGTYDYSNWNFAACRLLLSFLTDEDFFRALESDLAGQPGAVAELNSTTAGSYVSYVRQHIFAPAGLGLIHPRPVNATLGNFAWYYNFSDSSQPAGLMPDRRLTVGSGGWAISAKDYAKFIASLFKGDLLTPGQLSTMLNNDYGVGDRKGSNGTDTYYTHNGATTGDGVGGRSVWIYFPNGIAAAIQVNSILNGYEGYGVSLERILLEAWENAYGSVKPATLTYPRHILFHRAGDGWLGSRGLSSGASQGARNFDYDFARDGAPALFTHHCTVVAGSQTYLLRYKAGTGRAIMHPIQADGTLGDEVFDTEGWLSGWTHIVPFQTWEGGFLLLHHAGTGRIRTVPVLNSGNVGPHVTDDTFTSGFDVVEILRLAGVPHLFRHNTATGDTHLRVLNSDGSLGGSVYSATWTTGYKDFEFYTAGGQTFLFRYHPETGAARLNRIDGSLASTPVVLDAVWSKGWRTVRFFDTGSQAFFLRYNPDNGDIRMQKINADGTPGDEVWKSTEWLRATESTGPFDPATTGWSDILIYDASPGLVQVPQQLDSYADLPPEQGASINPLRTKTAGSEPIQIDSSPPQLTLERGTATLQWAGERGTRGYVERSGDLRKWELAGAVDGTGAAQPILLPPDAAGGAALSQAFYRMRIFEVIPPPSAVPGAGR